MNHDITINKSYGFLFRLRFFDSECIAMSLENYIDVDGLVGLIPQGEVKVCGSQNGVCYTGLAYALTQDTRYKIAILTFMNTLKVRSDWPRTGYERNSVTHDIQSFDDLLAACAVNGTVRDDFKNNFGFHPVRQNNSLRWWFFRNPVFVSCVLRPNSHCFIRDISIAITGLLEDGSTPFLLSFMISELYPTSEWAKRALRKRAIKRWLPNMFTAYYGLSGVCAEYFPPGHAIIELMHEFERKRDEQS